MMICLVYDCLYPHTVGGAERWYRNLAERLAASGHDVTYLTLRQWDADDPPDVPGVTVRAVGPRMELYVDGRRRILPPLRFGMGVLAHLLRHGRGYDAVHTASFPYFSLLAAGVARPAAGYRLIVDWHELWTGAYWREYLGPLGGRVGHLVQSLCVRVPHRAFCFSRLHARRLVEQGFRGSPIVLEGEYAGSLETPRTTEADPLVVFAGRHIPEKRVPALIPALAVAARSVPALRAEVYGSGPEHGAVLAEIAAHGLGERVRAPGFVDFAVVDAALRRALCMVLPSRREGYGLVVVEAAARGIPSVVVADPDNAATELVADGINGVICASADPETLAHGIVRVFQAGPAMRESTAAWFAANAARLSLDSSLDRVLESYGSSARS